jgi:hypothetical protein
VTATELTPDEISRELGIEPTRAARNASGESVWVLESSLPSSSGGDEHVEALLTQLRPHADALRELKGHRDIFLGFASENGQGGMVIPPAALGELAALEIELRLDLYPPQQSDLDS